MADTTFSAGTTVTSAWLNEVNRQAYRDVINVKSAPFNAVGDGVADDTAALQAARDYIAAAPQKYKLVFPAGIYKYSASPNWAIQNAVIEAEGEVRLRYTGTGDAVIFDGGAAVTQVLNVSFGTPTCRFFIEAPATAGDGIYLRAVHHSKICANVRGCGTGQAALRTEFSVCSEFWVSSTVNQEAWYTGAAPGAGYYLDQRGAGEQTAACQFHGPILEGIAGDGIVLVSAIMCQFWGNTSEGNTGRGVHVVSTLSLFNTFHGLDMEANASGVDVLDNGASNLYIGCLSDSSFVTGAGSRNIALIGGQYNSITHAGDGLTLDSIEYGSQGGVISGAGTNINKRLVFASGGSQDLDQPTGSLVATLNIPDSTPTTIVTLPSTGTRNYMISAFSPGAGNASAYNAYAIVAQDLGTNRILTQVDGTGLSTLAITMSGQNVQVTQTSGGAANVTVRAIPM